MAFTRYTTAGLFVGLAAIWGLSFVAARAALTNITPVLLAAFRFDIAALVMLGYASITTTKLIPSTQREWFTVIVGGVLFIALHHALLFAGQQFVTSAVAAVVICLDPILAAAFARVFLPEESLSLIEAVGLLFGVLGVGIIAGLKPAVILQTDGFGVLLVFFAAVSFALGAVITQRVESELPVQSMQAWMMIVGAPVLHGAAFVLPREAVTEITWSLSTLVSLGYLAVVAAGVGYFLYFELLERVGAIEINLVAYATPLFAAGGGWLLLGEQLQVQTIAGFGIILVGFVLIKREALRQEIMRYQDRVNRRAD